VVVLRPDARQQHQPPDARGPLDGRLHVLRDVLGVLDRVSLVVDRGLHDEDGVGARKVQRWAVFDVALDGFEARVRLELLGHPAEVAVDALDGGGGGIREEVSDRRLGGPRGSGDNCDVHFARALCDWSSRNRRWVVIVSRCGVSGLMTFGSCCLLAVDPQTWGEFLEVYVCTIPDRVELHHLYL